MVPRPHGADLRRRPYRQFILKIHSRCDIRCNYCYVYTMVDQRWRTRPPVMSRQTIDQTAARLAEYLRLHQLRAADVVLHGGEPLLAGAELIEYCVRSLRAAVGATVQVNVAIQTNGLRLSPAFLRLFAELGIRVGVSLDGDQAGHDRHRRDRHGRGTFVRASAGVHLLAQPAHRPLFSGLLCTIDLRNDPVATYEALLQYAPPAVDFLLPHGNWVTPPPGRTADPAATPYADWLAAVFDRWYDADRRETSVRMFDGLVDLLLGGGSAVEGLGLDPVRTVVVETDGSIEHSDLLTSAFEGAAETGLHVSRDGFDLVPPLPGHRGSAGAPAGSAQCRDCSVYQICGGGLRAHRYRDGSFDHPSVYCPDLYALITHVRGRVAHSLAALHGAVR
jgi:uncharacterized protein